MREILTIQLGQGGNQIGGKFLEYISHEHGINTEGVPTANSPLAMERINVYYTEARRFSARFVCVDTDSSSENILKRNMYAKLYKSDNIILGTEGTSNNYAKGYYTEGAELLDSALEAIRREAEGCDCLQGIQIVHSIGGGTGSGLGSSMLKKLSEEYPDAMICTFTAIPSPKVSKIVVEPYNSILSIPSLMSNAHHNHCFDNEALNDICVRNLRLPSPSIEDMNHLIANVMAGMTCFFRFPGQLNTDLRKLYVNMVPYPNLHFFIPSYAPIYASGRMQKLDSIPELAYAIFDAKNAMVTCEQCQGKYLTIAVLFRGLMSTRHLDELMFNIQKKNADRFAAWIPNHIKTAICDIPPRGLKLAATLIANTTAIRFLFEKISKKCGVMLNRRAFVHWYTGEGMELSELQNAQEETNALIDEYKENEKTFSFDSIPNCNEMINVL